MEKAVEILMIAAASLIAVTLHELAHGYVAYLMGDPTAKNNGRLTLNPIKHIDPFGLLALIVLKIGWAKPVPINPMYFRNRKKGMILVSLAGPLTNLSLSFFFALLCKLMWHSSAVYYLVVFFEIAMQINIGFAVFNLMPFPPLDGSKIVAALLPEQLEQKFYQYQRYLVFIVMILYFTNLIDYILYPPIQFLYGLLYRFIIF